MRTGHVHALLHKELSIAGLAKKLRKPMLMMRAVMFMPPFELVIPHEYLQHETTPVGDMSCMHEQACCQHGLVIALRRHAFRAGEGMSLAQY